MVQLSYLGSRLRGGVVERLDRKENDQGDDDCHQHNDNGDKRPVPLFLGAGVCGEAGAYAGAGCCWGEPLATGMRCVVSTAAGLAAGSGR